MSFHGLMGTGKNFVADMIVKNFYAAGDKSKFVYKYYGPAHFPLESEVDFYRVSQRMCSLTSYLLSETASSKLIFSFAFSG